MQPESNSSAVSVAEVKEGLRAVLESKTFRQAPRLGKLLQYICGKALLEEPQQVTEYTIAVDVFGKPLDFKESKDSSVRVEVHRLRKRLAQFYESEGADRRLQIRIPPGQYLPEFHVLETPREEVPAGAQDAAVAPVADQTPDDEAMASTPASEPGSIELPPEAGHGRIRHRVPAERKRRIWLYAAIAVGSIVAALGARAIYKARTAAVRVDRPERQAEPAGAGQALPSSVARVPLRLMAGYSGQPHIDASGFLWEPDRYYQGGRPWGVSGVPIARTNDPMLFQQWRSGEFSYHIPLAPGVYELHLCFVAAKRADATGSGENLNTLSVDINGERVIARFDIESDAMGPNIATERVFKDVRPASDGQLHVVLEGVVGLPLLNALEVLPGIPHKQIPVRLVAQPKSFVDRSGQLWRPDNYYLYGQPLRRDAPVAGTPDPGLFAGERYGHFSYAIPVDTRGRYTVTLYLAEQYFGPDAAGAGGAGSRVFNVMCNGVMLLEDFDIFKEVGSLRALKKTFYHLKPSAQGKLNLTFEPVVNYSVISAIEVLDESQ